MESVLHPSGFPVCGKANRWDEQWRSSKVLISSAFEQICLCCLPLCIVISHGVRHKKTADIQRSALRQYHTLTALMGELNLACGFMTNWFSHFNQGGQVVLSYFIYSYILFFQLFVFVSIKTSLHLLQLFSPLSGKELYMVTSMDIQNGAVMLPSEVGEPRDLSQPISED